MFGLVAHLRQPQTLQMCPQMGCLKCSAMKIAAIITTIPILYVVIQQQQQRFQISAFCLFSLFLSIGSPTTPELPLIRGRLAHSGPMVWQPNREITQQPEVQARIVQKLEFTSIHPIAICSCFSFTFAMAGAEIFLA